LFELEDAIYDLLPKGSFTLTKLTADNLSMREQYDLFNEATLIVAMEGGALDNIGMAHVWIVFVRLLLTNI
jgi:capsular polysaccharide biosynthesis protein